MEPQTPESAISSTVSSVSSQPTGIGVGDEQQKFILSPTVKAALDHYAPNETLCAADLARTILAQNDYIKKYARGIFLSTSLKDTEQKRTSSQWLDEVQLLFDPGRIQALTDPRQMPLLDGELVLIGLGLLDSELYHQLDTSGAFKALVEEVSPPLRDILSERGLDRLKATTGGPEPEAPADTVANWPDDPLQDTNADLLGRRAFAAYLARRIAAIPVSSGAYALHLYGPWGSGKSTMLNFLRKELKGKGIGDWLVVDFNAWRNQHIQPPWWSLMDTVFQQQKGALRWQDRWREYGWRFTSGRTQYIIAVVVVMWLLALIIFPLLSTATQDDPQSVLHKLAAGFDDVATILAVVTTIWGGVVTFNRSLLFGSSQAAQNYATYSRDPMCEVKEHFQELTQRLSDRSSDGKKKRRVCIFIDDLDRCQSSYVIDLLEGIQTLFRDANVVFVVAADRRWLNACYEQVYERMKPEIHEPGKALSTLFLEKTFRFSTPMPGIPPELKRRYWLYLLQVRAGDQDAELAAARAKAEREVAKSKSEAEVTHLSKSNDGRSFAEQRALREAAVVRLAAPDITERLEHTLEPYVELLEANPRAMRRLVNSYSANRALAILSETEVDRHQLVLWTILWSRWPQLAEHLEESPDILEKDGKLKIQGVGAELTMLLENPDVAFVLHGGSAGIPLNRATLVDCIRMRT